MNYVKQRLKQDFARYKCGTKFFKKLISWNEDYRVLKLIYHLRYVEYYEENSKGINKILYYWHYYNFNKYRVKSNITIFPNNFDTGLLLMHPGFRRIGVFVRGGKNCTILPLVLMGKKKPGIDCRIEIGDNCYISTGVVILGPVTIGNNVTIAAGAVVTHDVPDNALVGGVPAKIIRINT